MDDEEATIENKEGELPTYKSKFKKKKTTFLRYHVELKGVNPKNFTKDSLGGLDPIKVPWTL